MTTRAKTIAFIISLFGAATMATLLAWLFSLEGTKGLAEWGYGGVFAGLAGLGLLPLILALGMLPAFRDEASLLSALSAKAAAAAGLLCLFVTAGLGGYIVATARALPTPPPRLALVDPAAGIVPADPAVLRLSLSSDPHWGAESASAEARLAILRGLAAARPSPDAFFILGDNTEMGMEAGGWESEARDLSTTLGALPVRPLLGNHDALVDGQWHFRAFFFPKSLSSDSGSPYWYSIDAGPARLVVLDLLWGAEEFTAKKRAWLEEILSTTPPDKRIIVLSHCFFASSGYMDGTQPWFDHYGTLAEVAPILERHKVDLVVQGHNHYMELLERNGVAYATVGAMGGKPDPEPSHVSPWSRWFLRGTYGRLDLEVRRAGIELSFRDASGAALHSSQVKAAR